MLAKLKDVGHILSSHVAGGLDSTPQDQSSFLFQWPNKPFLKNFQPWKLKFFNKSQGSLSSKDLPDAPNHLSYAHIQDHPYNTLYRPYPASYFFT